VEGTTVPLPFGVQGEILRVKVNTISSSGIDLTVDKSDVLTEIQNIPETLPENVEAIGNEIEKQVKEIIKDVDKELENANQDINIFMNQLTNRVDKFINRGYHSSLPLFSTYIKF